MAHLQLVPEVQPEQLVPQTRQLVLLAVLVRLGLPVLLQPVELPVPQRLASPRLVQQELLEQRLVLPVQGRPERLERHRR